MIAAAAAALAVAAGVLLFVLLRDRKQEPKMIRLSGNLTVNDCFRQSKDDSLVFYLLEDMPGKDVAVEAVLVFRNGKVTVYNTEAIAGKYGDRTAGALLAVDQKELIEGLDEGYQKQLELGIDSTLDAAAGAAIGLYVKGKTDTKPYPAGFYYNRTTPPEFEYYITLLTDASHNTTQSEYLYISRPFYCGSRIIYGDKMLREYRYGVDRKSKDVVTEVAVAYDSGINTDVQSQLAKWQKEYEATRDELAANNEVLRENAWCVDLAQSLSGRIDDRNYVGFTVDEGMSMIALCEPGTKLSVDDPTSVRHLSAYMFDPSEDEKTVLQYKLLRNVCRSVEHIADRSDAAAMTERFLNEATARELIANAGYGALTGHEVLEFLGIQE